MAYRYRGLGATTSDLITASASRYGVPPSVALAVAKKESGFNQSAVGTSGERGVFQLMPGTARDLGVDPTDLSQNIDGGVRYLSQMYSQFGDWHTALEAYNAGPGRVSSGKVPAQSIAYADSIMGSVPGPDSASEDVVAGSTIDSWGSSDTQGAGISGTVMVALGLAAVGLLWAAGD